MMKPGDHFYIANRDKISFDVETFTKLYLPILGKTAFSLFLTFRQADSGRLSFFLEQLNIGQDKLNSAVERLQATHLIELYERHRAYSFALQSPLSYEAFLEDPFYRQLLIRRIGNEQVGTLLREEPKGMLLSKKFFEVYSIDFDEESEKSEPALSSSNLMSKSLDFESFKALMKKQNLSFANESADTLHLYSISEKFQMDWYALFKLAEETVNSDRTLNTGAMIERLTRQNSDQPEIPDGFSAIVKAANSNSPSHFLKQLKRQLGGFVSQDEERILSNLTKEKVPDPVQNILIHYVLVAQGNASLSAVFVNRLANDWMRQKISTAQEAIARILLVEAKTKESQKQKRTYTPIKAVKGAPEWSNPGYQNQTSDEEQKELEKIRQEALTALSEKEEA